MTSSWRSMSIWSGAVAAAVFILPATASAQFGGFPGGNFGSSNGNFGSSNGNFGSSNGNFGSSNGNGGGAGGQARTRFHVQNSVTGQGPTFGQPVQIITSFQSGNAGSNSSTSGAFGSTGSGFGNSGFGGSGSSGGAQPPPGVLLSAQFARTFFPSGPPQQQQGVGGFGGGVGGFPGGVGGFPGGGFGGGFPGGGFGGGFPGGGFGGGVGFRGF